MRSPLTRLALRSTCLALVAASLLAAASAVAADDDGPVWLRDSGDRVTLLNDKTDGSDLRCASGSQMLPVTSAARRAFIKYLISSLDPGSVERCAKSQIMTGYQAVASGDGTGCHVFKLAKCERCVPGVAHGVVDCPSGATCDLQSPAGCD
jgi:hypothetical protein